MGQDCCGNCGRAFPPSDPALEGRYCQCLYYEPESNGVLKPSSYSCKAWTNGDFRAGIAPYWCHPYSKERKTAEEIEAYLSRDAVTQRLREMESNGTFKRRAAKHIRKNGNGKRPNATEASSSVPSQTLSIKRIPLWELFLQGKITEEFATHVLDAMPPYVH
jgi:hypothetical protein